MYISLHYFEIGIRRKIVDGTEHGHRRRPRHWLDEMGYSSHPPTLHYDGLLSQGLEVFVTFAKTHLVERTPQISQF